MTTTIVLVRHGETDWNREHRFQGHADPPLNDAGRAQARELGRTLAAERFERVYSSPLRRAFETAEILVPDTDVGIEASDALKEVDVGSWSGLTVPEVEARFPMGYRRWLEFRSGWEDGETYDQLGRRVVAGLLAISERHPASTVLAVTHGGPIRSVLAYLQGLPFESDYASIGAISNCGVLPIAVQDSRIEAVD